MKLKQGLMLHDTPDGTIAVATGQAAKVLNGMIRLSPVAAFLFRHLMTDTTEEALVAAVLAEYHAEEETVRRDVAQFLAQLREARLLVD